MADSPSPIKNRIELSNLFQAIEGMEHYPWVPFHKGVEIYRLYSDDSGASAALLRYQPGATVPHHTHTGFEHIIVLSGAQSDGRGHYPAGTLLISGPGSGHAIASETGCVVLAIWQKPVEFSRP